MAYTLMLNSLIENSGLTVKEIAAQCKKMGVDVTPAYISTLRNDTNNRAPSDKVSHAIAKVCGAEYDDILVVEAYLDNAPVVVADFFKQLKKLVAPLTMGVMENRMTSQQQKEFETIIEQMPMAQFVIELSQDSAKNKLTKEYGAGHFKGISDNGELKIKAEYTPVYGLPVADDGMKPLICKDNLIQFEYKELQDYAIGDIVCYAKKENAKKIFARKIVTSDSKKKVTMLPINSEYSPETLNTADITILGKVVRVTATIK